MKNQIAEPVASLAPSLPLLVGGDAAADRGATRTWALARELARLALPSTLVMLLSGFSLVVDTYFVTGLGSAALAGVSLVFPIYLFLIMAFGGGIGVGISVVLSVRRGRGDRGMAQRAIGSAFALALGFAIAVAVVFALIGRNAFAQIANTEPVLDAAVSFARPVLLGAPVLALCLTISNILRSEKRVKEAAIMLLVSGGVNAALNPILIYGKFGAPALGVTGAGVATVIGFAISAVLGMYYLRGRAGGLSLGRSMLQVDRGDMVEILRIALPTLGTYIATNCVFLVLSAIWARFGTDALASYGLATRLEYLLAVVIYGVGSAILTLAGEAWGAGKHREVARICWTAAIGVVVATSVIAAALVIAPEGWFRLFGAAPSVVDSGVRYLRIAALAYPFYALALTLNYGYQTLSRAHLPLVWSLARGFVIAVPIALIAASHGSISGGAAGIAASLVVLGAMTAGWLPRSLARAVRKAESLQPPVWSSLTALPRRILEAPGQPPELEAMKVSGYQVSPYPLSYTLAWPYYFRRPSIRNHTRIEPLPARFERAEAAAQRKVRICAIGDIMVMQGDRIPEFDPALAALFSSADLIVGNCEAALGRTHCDPAAEHHFLFNMPLDYLAGIIERSGAPADRWYLSTTNNHTGDCGPDGLAATMQRLTALGVHPLGARVEGDLPFAVVERAGMRLGIAAWTRWLNIADARAWQHTEILGVPWQTMRADHRLDCLVGTGHWEYEWQHFPRAETRSFARRCESAGFDLLIGTHPHVLQPLEWLDRTLCAYSLGNFCSGLGVSFAARMCNVLMVDIGTEGPDRGKVIGYELHVFAQVNGSERISLVPVGAAPEPLRTRLTERSKLVLRQ